MPMTMASDQQLFHLHTLLSQLFLLLSIPTYIFTRYVIVAPFGRHVPKQHHWWLGPKLSARWSWFLFECPNLLWSWYYSYSSSSILYYQHQSSIVVVGSKRFILSTNAVLMFLFTLHYIHRDIIYPLRMNPNAHKVPLVVTIAAGIITTWNGYLQCYYLAHIRKDSPLPFVLPTTTTTTLSSPSVDTIQTWVGIGLFFVGMGINLHSDGVLRNLRKQSQTRGDNSTTSTTMTKISSQHKQQQQDDHHQLQQQQHAYYIPYSPMFTYISCPNFFGELLEWFGFALASHFSLPSVAFFIYTASNLIPRGIAHHHWYQAKFDDYPKERRWAVVPLIV